MAVQSNQTKDKLKILALKPILDFPTEIAENLYHSGFQFFTAFFTLIFYFSLNSCDQLLVQQPAGPLKMTCIKEVCIFAEYNIISTQPNGTT